MGLVREERARCRWRRRSAGADQRRFGSGDITTGYVHHQRSTEAVVGDEATAQLMMGPKKFVALSMMAASTAVVEEAASDGGEAMSYRIIQT